MIVDAIRYPREARGVHHHFFGEDAVEARAGHAVTDREAVDASAEFGDMAGEFATGYERRRHADLVLIGDEQDIGIVDRRGADPHPHLPFTDGRRWKVFDANNFRRGIGGADGG